MSRWVVIAAVALAVGAACASSSRRPDGHATGPHYTGPVIDMHAHVYFDVASATTLRDRPATPEALIAATRADRLAGIGIVVMAARPGVEETRALNDSLHALVQTDARFFGIGSVHPGDGAAALAELKRIKSLGFRVLKLHPNTQQLDLSSDALAAVVHEAGELGLPVLFDFSGALNAANIGPYVLLAARNPKTQIILAHMGGTKFADALLISELRSYGWYQDNLWVDLSAVASLYADSPYEAQLVWVIRQIGVDRVLFGSDFPYHTPAEAIRDVERLGLTAEEERKIFYTNAAGLFGLVAPPR